MRNYTVTYMSVSKLVIRRFNELKDAISFAHAITTTYLQVTDPDGNLIDLKANPG